MLWASIVRQTVVHGKRCGLGTNSILNFGWVPVPSTSVVEPKLFLSAPALTTASNCKDIFLIEESYTFYKTHRLGSEYYIM
jgi:hypothetical protein